MIVVLIIIIIAVAFLCLCLSWLVGRLLGGGRVAGLAVSPILRFLERAGCLISEWRKGKRVERGCRLTDGLIDTQD